VKKKTRTETEEFLFKLNRLMDEHEAATYDATKIFIGDKLIEFSKYSEGNPLVWREIKEMKRI